MGGTYFCYQHGWFFQYVWRPWGGESVVLTFNRPVGVVGESVTINSVDQVVKVGARQKVTTLNIQLECSLSTDLEMRLDTESLITGIQMDGNELPKAWSARFHRSWSHD